jgi:ethanolamine ammonia-lyase large subunit
MSGVAAGSLRERVAAKLCLADVELGAVLQETVIDYDLDELTRLIVDGHDDSAFRAISHLTVGGFREHLLDYETGPLELAAMAAGITPEMAAAVSKIMRNQDLIAVASKCRTVTAFRDTIGAPDRLSSRLQPNHPTDDPVGICISIVDGLLYGCGDACIGINPATDSRRSTIERLKMLDGLIDGLEIPTQSCVLTHVTNTVLAIEAGAPVDLVFQSIAGTEATNTSFGIDLSMLAEAQQAALELHRGTVGDNVMYFETGQGSCLSAGGDHGVDQQTLEARAYGVARVFSPLLVNTVVGFIGPEYLYNGKQIRRAGLEDHFCGKLLGLPMGCDVCYTNHAEADQNDSDDLMTLLGLAGCTFFMGVPGADDVMLGVQTTSFHDIAYLHHQLDRRPAPEFEDWLQRQGILAGDGTLLSVDSRHPLLQLTAR